MYLQTQDQQQDQQQDQPTLPTLPTFKVVVIGSGGCGKTNWVQRMANGAPFDPHYRPTQGVEVHPVVETFTAPVFFEGGGVGEEDLGMIKFNLWDCAGQEGLHGLGAGYWTDADAAVVMFTGSKLSMKSANDWRAAFRLARPGAPVVNVCTKVDVDGSGGHLGLDIAGGGDPFDPALMLATADVMMSAKTGESCDIPLWFVARALMRGDLVDVMVAQNL